MGWIAILDRSEYEYRDAEHEYEYEYQKKHEQCSEQKSPPPTPTRRASSELSLQDFRARCLHSGDCRIKLKCQIRSPSLLRHTHFPLIILHPHSIVSSIAIVLFIATNICFFYTQTLEMVF
jgi:hypothetical protein